MTIYGISLFADGVAVGRDRERIAGPARSWPAIGMQLERVWVPVRFVRAGSLGRLRSAEQRQPASQAAGRSRSRHVPPWVHFTKSSAIC